MTFISLPSRSRARSTISRFAVIEFSNLALGWIQPRCDLRRGGTGRIKEKERETLARAVMFLQALEVAHRSDIIARGCESLLRLLLGSSQNADVSTASNSDLSPQDVNEPHRSGNILAALNWIGRS